MMNNLAAHPILAAEIKDETGEVDFSFTQLVEQIDGMVDGFVKILPNLAIGIIVFVLFLFAGKLAKKLIKKAFGDGEKQSLGIVLGRLASWLLLLCGILLSMAIIAPSVEPADLLATLGIGGVAIGFAFKDILQNFLAGLLILIRQPFSIGDQIIVGDFEGTVEAIETRSTLIKTYDGRRIVIPNSVIFMNSVIVNTAFDVRRSQYDVGVGCNDNMDKAIEIITETVQSADGVLADPAPEAIAVALADSANIIRARWWTNSSQSDVIHVQSKVIVEIERALTKNAIDMPYPTQVVLFHDQTEETDGIRSQQREGWPSGGDNDPKTRRIADSLKEQHNISKRPNN